MQQKKRQKEKKIIKKGLKQDSQFQPERRIKCVQSKAMGAVRALTAAR